MTPELQAMQRDDAPNPAMLWVQGRRGALEPRRRGGSEGLRGLPWRCDVGDARRRGALSGLRRDRGAAGHAGAAHRCLPRAAPAGRAVRAPRARSCWRSRRYVALQSRGQPIAPPPDPRLEPFRARGERLYRQRIGQLDLSCAQCHDEHAGQRLAGSVIPQAHPTGYPIYRLEWQGLGSLQRRLRSCMSGVRAEPYPLRRAELVELETYLAQRAAGLKIETPAVRP